MDGTFEDKIFAPGYGEFSTGDPSGDLEAVALAVPIDALGGPVPEEVEALSDGAEKIFVLAASAAWSGIEDELDRIHDAWADLNAGGVPPMLEAETRDALDALDAAVASRDRAQTRQASIPLALAALDFELRHEERSEIDLDLIEVWLRQLEIDRQARDRAAVRGDVASIRWIRDRLPQGQRARIEGGLAALEEAVLGGDWSAVETAADALGR
jgi:hypothetical protein